MYCIQHDPTKHEKKNAPAKLNLPLLNFEQSLPARSSVLIVFLHVFHQNNPRSEPSLEISTLAPVNSVGSLRVNGLHIKDIDNLFSF